MKNKRLTATVLILAIVLTAVSGASIALAAPSVNYYICYESDGYRVKASNVLKADGDVYTVSPYLSRGDRFVISDNAGSMWGDEKGQPVVITESGTHRYTVIFSPSASLAGGGYVAVEDYSPADFELLVDGASAGNMTYLRANIQREEYYFYADLSGGEVVSVRGKNGTYGENGPADVGVGIPQAGKYRLAFTADEDNLFEDGKYIVFEEYPKLYLLCEANGYEKDESFLFRRDESVVYRQYTAKIDVPEKDFELEYSVLDDFDGEEYKPSESGKITVKDKGEYEVLYSPDRIYSASGGASFHTAVRKAEKFYDGWFVLGDFNGFEFIDDDVFSEKYELVKNDEKAYDEYTLNITVTQNMLDEFGGRAEFYITDGADIYRRPTGGNIGIEKAGEYKLTFSPTHDYGRGYRYRYEKIADDALTETVSVTSARQLAEILSDCTSPEYSLNKTFELTCDVDLSGVEYTPALVFAGTFDGLYRTVRGVASKDGASPFLFREITSDGCIKRVSFDVKLDCDGRNAALVGENNGVIEQVKVSGSVKGDSYVGSIAAVNGSSAAVKACENTAKIIGVMNVGGIVGFNAGSVENCVNAGEVDTTPLSASDSNSMLNVGGIVGYDTGNILACENRGAVGSRQGRYVGGIVGLAGGGLFANTNIASVGGARYVGGIVGYYGRFTADGESGGIGDYLTGGRFEQWLDEYFGSDSGAFEESEDNGVHEIFYNINRGPVLSDSYVGGIAGHAGATLLTIKGCVSTGDVSSRGGYAGGIVGSLGECRLSGCMSYGDVIASREYVGGIAGEAVGRVENSFSSAYVDGEGFVGGIAGKTTGAISGCISRAFVETASSGENRGMIAGDANVSLCANNFYLEESFGVGGINGVSYGEQSEYAAHRLSAQELASEGMLSPYLVGLDSDEWLAGENEPRYPVPRMLTEVAEPSIYADKAQFHRAFESVQGELETLSDTGSKTVVDVTFYAYDFDAQSYKRVKVYRLHKGEGLEEKDIPALEERERYFTWWDRTDFSRFDENTRIFENFDKAKTTLASDDTDDPLVFVEGKFYSDTRIVLERNGEYISIKLMRGDEEIFYDDVTVKYLVGDPSKNKIKLVLGSEIVDANATQSGRYLAFTLKKDWAFAVESTGANLIALWIVLAALGGALAAAAPFAIVFIVKKAKAKKAA